MKKLFDGPVGTVSPGLARAISEADTKFLESQIRSLENECRGLRETLRDRYAMAALTGILAGNARVDREKETIAAAFAHADEALWVRSR